MIFTFTHCNNFSAFAAPTAPHIESPEHSRTHRNIGEHPETPGISWNTPEHYRTFRSIINHLLLIIVFITFILIWETGYYYSACVTFIILLFLFHFFLFLFMVHKPSGRTNKVYIFLYVLLILFIFIYFYVMENSYLKGTFLPL